MSKENVFWQIKLSEIFCNSNCNIELGLFIQIFNIEVIGNGEKKQKRKRNEKSVQLDFHVRRGPHNSATKIRMDDS